MRLPIIAVAVIASGCAWQTEAISVGQNRYQISANASPARGGVTGARGMVLNKANRKCAEAGMYAEIEAVETDRAWPSNGVATATFKCYPHNN